MTLPLILVLNAGSSSLKFALCRPDGSAELTGEVQRLGSDRPSAKARDAGGTGLDLPDVGEAADAAAAADRLLPWLREQAGDRLAAVGHRIVHGGGAHGGPVRATSAVLEELDGLVPLAPLHEPHNLAPVRRLLATMPDLRQVLSFDTAFHRTQPAIEQRYALPPALHEAGIQRYGFHGLSYASVIHSLREREPTLASGRLVVAHLGSGASLCAIRDGRSLATTMGFTPLDGVPMGTRCGALDPGVVLHMVGRMGIPPGDVERLLYRQSGLKGLSGLSGDVRDLIAADSEAARFALELFAYRVAGEIARLVVPLGGLDGLVFTAGIGQHQPAIRAMICSRLGWLGVRLDAAANDAGGPRLSADGGVAVLAWPTDEQAVIAREAAEVCGLG